MDNQNLINPARLESRMTTEFRSLAFLRREFPMLANGQVSDVGLAIHSLGLNYLAALGRELGCSAVTDFPLESADCFLTPQPGRPQAEVRPDVIWFDRQTSAPILLAEFERYEEVMAKRRTLSRKPKTSFSLTTSPPASNVFFSSRFGLLPESK